MYHELPTVSEPGSYPVIFDPSVLPEVFALPFSKAVAREIGQRAHWMSEVSGQSFFDGYVLHMAHLNHDKTNPLYNDPSMGICVTVAEHLIQHQGAVGHAQDIGLTEAQNNYAIRQLAQTEQRTRKWHEEHK